MAGSSTTITFSKIDTPYAGTHGIVKVLIEWVGDGVTGLPPDTAFDAVDTIDILGRYCALGVTNPGGVAPDDNYNIEILDEHGCDIFGGELHSRDTANSEQAVPKIGSAYGTRLCAGILTFTLDTQTVVSATGECILYFEM